MPSLKIEHSEDPAKNAGKYISELLRQFIDKPILLLLAGGSSVQVLEHISSEYLSDQLTVTVTDDRFSEELDENNFAILQSTSFYNDLIQVDAFCIDTQVLSGEALEGYRARFEKNIREWKKDFPTGKIIALYGMGTDGHTAGMIPGILDKESFDAEFNTEDRLVGSIDATKTEQKDRAFFRITTTLPFMKKWVDHSIFYITGENKKPALVKALKKDGDQREDYFELPAKVISEMKDAVVFTDIQLDI